MKIVAAKHHRSYIEAMNSENFHEYLKNPSKLHQVNYQELKSLVLQYPFSPNLRYLLLLKSLLDNNKDHERNLTAASVYSIDRKKLWQLMKQYARLQEIHENYALTEDYLELKDLSVLDDVVEESQSDVEEVPLFHQIIPNESTLETEDFDNMDDSELQSFFSEEEDLGFLEELFGEQHLEEPGHAAPNSDYVGDEDAHMEENDPQFMEDVESLQGMHEQDDATDSLPAEIPATEEPEPLLTRADFIEHPQAEIEEDGADSTSGVNEMLDKPAIEEEASHIEEVLDVDLEDILENLAGQDESESLEGQPENPHDAIPFEVVNDLDPEMPSPELEQQPSQPQPIPKDSFNNWLQTLRPPKVSILEGEAKPSPLRKVDTDGETGEDRQDDARQIAQKSISEDNDIATETLAAVLAMQGHKEKAIAMYERLSLQYPEKSSFFAAKIKELKK